MMMKTAGHTCQNKRRKPIFFLLRADETHAPHHEEERAFGESVVLGLVGLLAEKGLFFLLESLLHALVEGSLTRGSGLLEHVGGDISCKEREKERERKELS